jgi:armadillo repeat-containing protein 6
MTKKKISQEYFDSVVTENIDDLGMSEQEAIEDAVAQLTSQGADLSIICKYTIREQNELIDSLKKLLDLIPKLRVEYKDEPDEKTTEESINAALTLLERIREKFNKDLSFRCLATRQPEPNALYIFLSYLNDLRPPSVEIAEKFTKTYDHLIEAFLSTFDSYLNQQSDVLDKKDLTTLIRLTGSDERETSGVSGFGSHPNVLKFLLKCINTSCQWSESNRQYLVENGLCENLMKIFMKHQTNDEVLCETCLLVRSLLLDDDMRVEFSNAHEHAKFIASKLNGLDILLHIGLSEFILSELPKKKESCFVLLILKLNFILNFLANQNRLNEDTLASLVLTLSRLAVRNEFCQEICDKGGLKFVLKCIEGEKNLKNVSLLKSSLSLLKSVCNNDQVKYEATKSNAIDFLKHVLEKYASNTQVSAIFKFFLARYL